MARKRMALDPPNGDYVKYIEDIQNGKIKPEGALKPSLPMHDPVPNRGTPSTSTTTTKKKFGAPPEALYALAGFLVVAGIGLLAYGILTDTEPCIPIGMFTLFGGFVFSANLKK